METTPAILKFIELLADKGISVKEDDELRHDGLPLENVVFSDGETTTKIANEIFYRHSGVCKAYEYTETKGKPAVKVYDMTDEIYYNYLYNMIMLHF